MQKKTQKLLSMLLVLAMLLTLLPTIAFAAPAEKVTELATGDKVVIYCNAYSKALGAFEAVASFYNAGVDAALVDGAFPEASLTDDVVWDVTVNDDNTYCFSNAGRKLSMDTGYSSTFRTR